jgi:hypothetical protein
MSITLHRLVLGMVLMLQAPLHLIKTCAGVEVIVPLHLSF